MTEADVAAWDGFAVAMAGAAAVLAGLVFVAVSVNIDRILAVGGLPGRAFRLATTQIVTIPVILAGASLLGWPAGGLYWLVAGVVAALVAATGNAWVLLVEVVRYQRYRPPSDHDRDA
jgi:hypothetical protein